jgi:hypothetical protein
MRLFYVVFCNDGYSFTKYSRFADIKRKLKWLNQKAKLLTILVLLFSLSGFARARAQS